MKNYIGISRDHSASMSGIAKDAGRDYNAQIQAIKDGSREFGIDTIVSVVKCGVGRAATVEREVVNSDVNKLVPISERGYVADGCGTPLFDSVGDLIEQLQAVPDANDPGVTFVVMVITDGGENASRKWTGESIARKINELRMTDRWTFSFRVPRGYKNSLVRFGIPSGNILEWDQTSAGVQTATVATASAVRSFYTGLSKGITSTDKFYADLSTVTLKEVKANLVDISKQVIVYEVDDANDGVQIRDFVVDQGVSFTKGCAFYQLLKTESVQDYKQLAVRDNRTGSVYSGPAARDLIGIPHVGNIKLAPGNFANYEIYIQSTSVNRKLVKGMGVMIRAVETV